jgi:hypothetical protein
MIIKANDENAHMLEVRDINGVLVPLVHSYNTKTKIAQMYIGTRTGALICGMVGPITIKVKLAGSKLVNKNTGKEIV